MIARESIDAPALPTLTRLEQATLRAALYRALATLFLKPPTNSLLQPLASPASHDQIRALLGKPSSERVEALSRFGPRPADADRQEFFDLLAVPSARYLTPFESAFRDEFVTSDGARKPRLFGPSARAVERAYAAAGCAVAVPELPDHAGCELAFLAELCQREAAAIEQGDIDRADACRRAQADFLQNHASRWLPALSLRLEAHAQAAYLKVVAVLVRETLRNHAESIARDPAASELPKREPRRAEA